MSVNEKETFTERFNRLTASMSVSLLAKTLDVTEGAIRKLRRGDTQSIELSRAVKLCRVINVSPYYLASEDDPPSPMIDKAIATQQIRADEIEELSLAREVQALREEQREASDRFVELAQAVEDLQAAMKRPSPARSKAAG